MLFRSVEEMKPLIAEYLGSLPAINRKETFKDNKVDMRQGEMCIRDSAYTSVDETVYNISNVPVTTPGAIDSCLLILHD